MESFENDLIDKLCVGPMADQHEPVATLRHSRVRPCYISALENLSIQMGLAIQTKLGHVDLKTHATRQQKQHRAQKGLVPVSSHIYLYRPPPPPPPPGGAP